MREGARLQAAIILLDKILQATAPADSVVTGYFRLCRYMGSGDRRAISETVYNILRRYEELQWFLQGMPTPKSGWGRLLVLAYAHKILNLSLAEIQGLCKTVPVVKSHIKNKENFQADKFDPEPLSAVEKVLIQEMGRLKPDAMPLWVRLNIPQWIFPRLEAAFGDGIEKAARALNVAAPLDLRVNTLKTSRTEVLMELKGQGFDPVSTPWSPVGVRLKDRRPLSNHELWIKGHIEVQDEGSQVLGLLVDAQPGMTVLDFCAGAGGKTLAMAAAMENRGRIVATDVAAWRLLRSRERLRRAGACNVEFRALEEEATVKWLKRQAGRFDRVLVDAPCSGSGTWRRNPDLKRRLTEQDLEELKAKQLEIITRAAPLVKKGGRLVYATCSLFAEENLEQVEIFLKESADFSLMPIENIWLAVLKTPCPPSFNGTLQLTPHTHQVDGFFMAVMERKT